MHAYLFIIYSMQLISLEWDILIIHLFKYNFTKKIYFISFTLILVCVSAFIFAFFSFSYLSLSFTLVQYMHLWLHKIKQIYMNHKWNHQFLYFFFPFFTCLYYIHMYLRHIKKKKPITCMWIKLENICIFFLMFSSGYCCSFFQILQTILVCICCHISIFCGTVLMYCTCYIWTQKKQYSI